MKAYKATKEATAMVPGYLSQTDYNLSTQRKRYAK